MATGEGSKGPHVRVCVKGHLVKEDGHKGQLGACPFSCRVLLTLEEKEIPYSIEFIDLDNKPSWLNDINPQGTVPVVQELSTESWFVDSDAIADWLEEKYGPDAEVLHKALRKLADCPQPGRQLWDAFMKYLTDDNAKEELNSALKEINDAVNDQNPYVGGQDPCAYDLDMAPKLYIARLGCQKIKGWDFADEYVNIKAYIFRMIGRKSWKNACSWDEESIVQDLNAKKKAMAEK